MIDAAWIKAEAAALGFDACGITAATPLHELLPTFEGWLDAGYAAEMGYLRDHLTQRFDPALLVPGAKSFIMVLMNYRQAERQPSSAPQIASYAYGKDYHYVIKSGLNQLLERLQERLPGISGRAFSDSAPILERAYAAAAGLGFIGKSNMLIHPRLGSYTLIGALLVDHTLPYDVPMNRSCGSCSACLEACPTGALQGRSKLDARRCLSYLTIEQRDPLPEAYFEAAGNRLFGCECCIAVCPWNKSAPVGQVTALQATSEFLSYNWEEFSRSDYKRLFKGSALARAGYKKISTRLEQIAAERATHSPEGQS